MDDRFSTRLAIPKEEVPITIRQDAPDDLRQYLFMLFQNFEKSYKVIRGIVCRAVHEAPDPGNWAENDFMASEIQTLLSHAKWYYIYDLIELFYAKLTPVQRLSFSSEINIYFAEHGIGWKLEDGIIEMRGDQQFETILQQAELYIEKKGLQTAKNEIEQAIHDLSKRPNSDITGAIQHSMASLECVAREVTGDIKMTLGELIKKNRGIVPSPLDIVIEKVWGFSSEQGRHLREGREPQYEEAELLVGLSATLCTYLVKKNLP